MATSITGMPRCTVHEAQVCRSVLGLIVRGVETGFLVSLGPERAAEKFQSERAGVSVSSCHHAKEALWSAVSGYLGTRFASASWQQ